MKLSKINTPMGGYVTEDGRFNISGGYPSLHALKCWTVEERGNMK